MALRTPYENDLNWNCRIYCFGCGDQMIPEPNDGWRCLSCGSTLMYESDDRWHFREDGFYQEDEGDLWLGEKEESEESDEVS